VVDPDDRRLDRCCAVVELRQYTLHPSRRDDLIELFDREFVETQEATGMHIVAQFRDVDDPDRFVWIRGFTDMTSRATALQAFYGGPVWKERRTAAASTMIDSDDVLLLKPAFENAGLAHPPPPRPSATDVTVPAATIVATTHSLTDPLSTTQVRDFAAESDALVEAHGARSLAWYVTEPAENTFPALPVRTDVSVLVNLAAFDDVEHHRTFLDRQAGRPEAGTPRLSTSHLRLEPTARSQLR
jgi:quinol monooxygenase YgiN